MTNFGITSAIIIGIIAMFVLPEIKKTRASHFIKCAGCFLFLTGALIWLLQFIASRSPNTDMAMALLQH